MLDIARKTIMWLVLAAVIVVATLLGNAFVTRLTGGGIEVCPRADACRGI